MKDKRKMKNLFQRIIVICSLISVLFTTAVLPSFASESDTDTKTIAPGTYRFNDELIRFANGGFYGSFSFAFDGIIYNYLTVGSLNTESDFGIVYSFGLEFSYGDTVAYATGESKSVMEEGYDLSLLEGWQSEECKTITILEEAEVSVEFYNWFVLNTSCDFYIIEAGSYRFNGAISDLGFTTEVTIPFVISSDLNLTDEQFTEINDSLVNGGFSPLISKKYDISFSVRKIYFCHYDDYYLMSYRDVVITSVPDSSLGYALLGGDDELSEVYHSQLPSDELVLSQVFTVTQDTVVSPEFGVWFYGNTVEMNQISGKWKLANKPTFPQDDLVEDVHLSVDVDLSGVKYTAYTDTVYIGSDGVLGANIIRNEPDQGEDFLGVGIGFENGMWLTNSLGDGIREWDFGTEPQYVSARFFNWVTSNSKLMSYEDDEALTQSFTIYNKNNPDQTYTYYVLEGSTFNDIIDGNYNFSHYFSSSSGGFVTFSPYGSVSYNLVYYYDLSGIDCLSSDVADGFYFYYGPGDYMTGFTDGYNNGYSEGFSDCLSVSADELQSLNPDLYDSVYDSGYLIGLNKGQSSSVADSLLSNIFTSPVNALNSVILASVTLDSGEIVDITLWSILSTVVVAVLIIWFLKIAV